AGANQLITRRPVKVSCGTAGSFAVTAPVWNITTRKETLYFLPDMVLVRQKKRFGSISYRYLEVAASLNEFRENGRVPADAHVLRTTWRYANRDGGPDRRFANNTQIPVALYGEVALTSVSGLRITLLTSSSQVAQIFATAMQSYAAALASAPGS